MSRVRFPPPPPSNQRTERSFFSVMREENPQGSTSGHRPRRTPEGRSRGIEGRVFRMSERRAIPPPPPLHEMRAERPFFHFLGGFPEGVPIREAFEKPGYATARATTASARRQFKTRHREFRQSPSLLRRGSIPGKGRKMQKVSEARGNMDSCAMRLHPYLIFQDQAPCLESMTKRSPGLQ